MSKEKKVSIIYICMIRYMYVYLFKWNGKLYNYIYKCIYIKIFIGFVLFKGFRIDGILYVIIINFNSIEESVFIL